MKTHQYNPSQLELDFATAFKQLSANLQQHLPDIQIISVDALPDSDNPVLLYKVQDAEGDVHELVVQFIQRPDGLLPEK